MSKKQVIDSNPGTSQIIPAGAILHFRNPEPGRGNEKLDYIVLNDIDHDETQKSAGVKCGLDGCMTIPDVNTWVDYLIGAGYIKDTRTLN